MQALVDNPACEVVALPEGLFRGPIRVALARMGGKSAVEVRGASRDGSVFESGGQSTFQIEPDATLHLTSLTIRGNAGVPGTSGTAGAAVYNRGTATLDGVAVTRNIGVITGALTNEHRMEIRSSTISENVNRGGTRALGGAIYNSGELYIGGSAITGNEAGSTGLNYGGGVCNDGGSVTIEDSEIAGNRTSNGINIGGSIEGGGVFSSGGAIDIRRSRIHQNRVENAGNGAYGGGIAAWGSTVTLSADTEVSFNELVAKTEAYGAGIYLKDHAQLHADGVTFEGNVGKAGLWVGGAAVMAKQTSLRLAGNRLANNRLEATDPLAGQLLGGVLYVREGTLKMSGGQLVGNTMRNGSVKGGLVRVDEYTYPSEVDEALEFEGVTISENVVTTRDSLDGGLLSAVRTLRLKGCDIRANAVTSTAQYGSRGGLVHFQWSRESTTPLLPGALSVEGTHMDGNTVVSTNGASGGLLYAYLERTSPVVVTFANSTFVDNTVASSRGLTQGGLFQLEETRHVAIVDSVLRGNTITSGVDGGSTMNPGVVHGGLLYLASTSGFYGDPDPDGEFALVRTDVSRNRVGTSLATDTMEGGLFMLYVPWHAAGHLLTFSATNSTISENVVQARSAVNGGLLNVFNRDGSDVLVDLSNATLALNQTNGPLGTIFKFGEPPTSPSYRAAVVRLRNTILARNNAPGGADCPLQGPLSTTTSSGHNLLGDVTACAGMTPASTDLVGHDPLFGASGDHGGRVPSLPIAPESPAVDGGDPAGCVDATGVLLSTDQRGLPRPSGARCDIGAFELQLP
ncbi:hypothetical protein F0U62_41805 [Cystobacter fuscus]|uniref:choice-of-anchor Q domain-containing protein n=1 Tax=Cystobacter fuscus TaxID=43 RepID=UPI002B28BF30|nr:hypothetical protein F0U62_41805 [Cystobacter fuscus]